MIARLYYIAILVILALTSCKNSAEEQQALPDKEELIGLFIDMHMAEVPMSRVPQSMRDSVGKVLRGRIALDHNMEVGEMQEIIHEVQMDLDLSAEIYDSVEVRLKRMQKTGDYTHE